MFGKSASATELSTTRTALFLQQLLGDVLGDVVLPVAAGIPAPGADGVPLLDQRVDLGLDLGPFAAAVRLFQVELVKPIPDLGQPGAFLRRERRDGGRGHGRLSCLFARGESNTIPRQ